VTGERLLNISWLVAVFLAAVADTVYVQTPFMFKDAFISHPFSRPPALRQFASFLQYYSVQSKGLSDFLAQNARNRLACPLPAGRFSHPAHDKPRDYVLDRRDRLAPTAQGRRTG
jgi:hypothetical protein